MFNIDRTDLRRMYAEAWRKYRVKHPLEPIEQLIAEIVRQHPEYHDLLESPDSVLHREFPPEEGESNPFLHLAMHVALKEQISTDQPFGITSLYQRLVRVTGDLHEADHELMECLAEMIWNAQRHHQEPDQKAYLKCVKRRLKKARFQG